MESHFNSSAAEIGGGDQKNRNQNEEPNLLRNDARGK
jgi:hypothetical protein